MGGVFSLQRYTRESLSRLEKRGEWPPEPEYIHQVGPYACASLVAVFLTATWVEHRIHLKSERGRDLQIERVQVARECPKLKRETELLELLRGKLPERPDSTMECSEVQQPPGEAYICSSHKLWAATQAAWAVGSSSWAVGAGWTATIAAFQMEWERAVAGTERGEDAEFRDGQRLQDLLDLLSQLKRFERRTAQRSRKLRWRWWRASDPNAASEYSLEGIGSIQRLPGNNRDHPTVRDRAIAETSEGLDQGLVTVGHVAVDGGLKSLVPVGFTGNVGFDSQSMGFTDTVGSSAAQPVGFGSRTKFGIVSAQRTTETADHIPSHLPESARVRHARRVVARVRRMQVCKSVGLVRMLASRRVVFFVSLHSVVAVMHSTVRALRYRYYGKATKLLMQAVMRYKDQQKSSMDSFDLLSVQHSTPSSLLGLGIEGSTSVVLSLVAAWGWCKAAETLLDIIQTWCLAQGPQRFSLLLKERVFSALVQQDCEFFDRMPAEQSLALIRQAGDQQVADKILTLPMCMVNDAWRVCATYRRLWRAHPSLVVSLGVVTPLLSYLMTAARLKVQEWRTQDRKQELDHQGRHLQVLGPHMRTMRAQAGEMSEVAEHSDWLSRRQQRQVDALLVSSLVNHPQEIVCDLLRLLGLAHAVILMLQHSLDPELVYEISSAGDTLRGNLLAFQHTVPRLKALIVPAAQILDLLHTTPTIGLHQGQLPHPSSLPLRGALTFTDVQFTYPAASRFAKPALRGLNFTAPALSMVALCGPSGSGKSTALGLILRFYNPDQGMITLDNIDISTLPAAWLRGEIGYVAQEPCMFRQSVRDNLVYGLPDPEAVTLENLSTAARAAQVLDVIQHLPQGWDTLIDGSKLSGGQKQRLAIARALLRKPKILLLDEATSALDAEAEASVQVAVQAVTKHCTIVVVAHRLSTVLHADKIVYIQNGVDVETGTPNDLLEKAEGKFAAIFTKQVSPDVHVSDGYIH